MAGAYEHRGHRLIETPSPRGGKSYRLPERYARGSVRQCIYSLADEGWTRAEISRVTGILYQHVRNVLEARPRKAPEMAEESRGPAVELGRVGSHVAFADLVMRAERGEEIRIERDGELVARLVPAGTRAADAAIAATCRRMDELAEQATLGDLSIRELIDEGRAP